MAEKPRFVTFTGRPLSGKTHLIKMLLGVRQDFEIFAGKSFTTRPPREGDVPGEYEHVSNEEFARMKDRGELAWDFPHGDYLVGTRALDIIAAENRQKVSVMTLVPEAVGRLILMIGAEKVLPLFIECSEADTYLRLPERREELQKTLDRLRKTKDWRRDMLGQGIMFTLVKNPNEGYLGSMAFGEILSILERHGI